MKIGSKVRLYPAGIEWGDGNNHIYWWNWLPPEMRYWGCGVEWHGAAFYHFGLWFTNVSWHFPLWAKLFPAKR